MTQFCNICADDLEQRLAPRRAAERLGRKGGTVRGRGGFMLRVEPVVLPLVRAALRAAGLYERGAANALRPEVRHLRFELPRLPARFDGFRILHLSDLHIDGQEAMAAIVAELASGIPADLCVLTGDYRFEVDGPTDEVCRRMRTILRAIRARYGVLAILGNHDEADMALELAGLGVRMLIDEAVEIGSGFWIAGVDDAHEYGCEDLSGPLAPVPADAFKLLLAHTPELYAQAAEAGVDLYLCGHTHAGQVCLPGIGPLVLNAACPRTYARGRWRHGGTQGYTSAGIGCSLLPVRYHCPPEIGVIELACGGPRPEPAATPWV
jgi:predicted MPP superfamily phosphohydrolase